MKHFYIYIFAFLHLQILALVEIIYAHTYLAIIGFSGHFSEHATFMFEWLPELTHGYE